MLETRPELFDVAGETLASVLAEHRNRVPGHGAHHPELGLLGPAARHAIYLDAIEQVVLPCAEHLGLRLDRAA